MKITETGYQFESTGRTVAAHGTDIIGIAHGEGFFDIGLGYDSPWFFDEHEQYDEFDAISFTKEEKVELSDYMINLWNKFKNS